MDRRLRPVHLKQSSAMGSPMTPSSPSMSPLQLRHSRSGSTGTPNMKKAHTKAAAQRLAQVMSHQSTDDDEEDEEDLNYEYNPSSSIGSIGLGGGRRMVPRSPMKRPNIPARVKSYQSADEDDDADEPITYKPGTGSVGRAGGRSMRARSPATVRTRQEQQPSTHATPVTRPSPVRNSLETPSSAPSSTAQPPTQPASNIEVSSSTPTTTMAGRPANIAVGHSSPLRASLSGRSSNNSDDVGSPARSSTPGRISTISAEKSSSGRPSNISVEKNSAHSSMPGRPEQPLSARSTPGGRLGVKTVPLPSATSAAPRPFPIVPAELPNRRDQRMSLDLGSMKLRAGSGNHNSNSNLQDEIDMLQEENENLMDKVGNIVFLCKLRLAAERCEEAEARARQLEKQVATLGEGVTLDARLLSRQALKLRCLCVIFCFDKIIYCCLSQFDRKEAALQQRESLSRSYDDQCNIPVVLLQAALKVAEQTTKSDELAALKMDAEIAREEAASAMEQLTEAASEVKSLRNMTQRMILTQEEMEEVVLKRCWLAWYWNLCVRHAIHAEIAKARYEYWSSFAPLPYEIVVAAGQRAMEEETEENNDSEERQRVLREAREISGEGTVESMLLVEKGLREQASLKVGEAVAFAMAQQRRSQILKSDEVKLAGEAYLEAFELTQDESEDVRFKQAWLAYFWRRAKDHGVEPDIAEDRLQFWINHSNRSSFSHDAVEVERGLLELRKLGLENQLWQAARKGLETDAMSKAHLESNF
ncbi:hypothetical protein Tsubulata_006726 [Turnera subulata]|uniref:Coiled-coil domain-containing protein SCD2 n=1 Tax=Turnera subulata TaxID=218843 RepID=A0A9Q0GGK7_9ROSI|nr:hypothetical protein Tsubulata_006726 [Turnera subulata]